MQQPVDLSEEAFLLTLAAEVVEGADSDLSPDLTLHEFACEAWHVLEPATPFVDSWHIGAICEHLQAQTDGQIRRLLINMPPRHMKSLLVAVLWPMWEWTFKPSVRWLYSSYAFALSKRDSLKCRRLIESVWYQSNYGHVFHLTTDQNEKARFENNKTGYRLATSVDGTNTGEGGQRLVIDDPHNIKEIESDTQRESVIEWFDGVMSTRFNDPKTGTVTIVMQRGHEKDLSGHVLEQGGYDHLCLPAEYEPYPFVDIGAMIDSEGKRITSLGWTDPRTEIGSLLCTERFGPEEIEALKKSLGSYRAAGQLQQRPSPAQGLIFKKHWWRFWHPKDRPLPAVPVRLDDGTIFYCPCEPLPDSFEQQLQSWDMTFKDTKGTDFVVGQVWGRQAANKFLLDQIRERLSFTKTCEALKKLSEKWPKATLKLVEDKANGPAVISALSSSIAGLVAVEPEGSKESRAHAVSPEVEAGNVYLPHPSIAPWIDAFIHEHGAFPNGANDDQVDGTTQALVRWKKSSHISLW